MNKGWDDSQDSRTELMDHLGNDPRWEEGWLKVGCPHGQCIVKIPLAVQQQGKTEESEVLQWYIDDYIEDHTWISKIIVMTLGFLKLLFMVFSWREDAMNWVYD